MERGVVEEGRETTAMQCGCGWRKSTRVKLKSQITGPEVDRKERRRGEDETATCQRWQLDARQARLEDTARMQRQRQQGSQRQTKKCKNN